MNHHDRERYKNAVLGELAGLDEKVRSELLDILIDTAHLYIEQISKCESPIEKILLMWLIHYVRVRQEEYKLWDNVPVIHIEPQRTVERGKKKYRIDIALDEWDGDEVPAEYILQCQHYMAVTGYDAWWIAVLIGGNKFRYKKIQIQAQLSERLTGFVNSTGYTVKDVVNKAVEEFLERYGG